MVFSNSRISIPNPDEVLACGSASISSTFLPSAAKAAAKLIEVVVLPTPPFWFANEIIFPIYFLSLMSILFDFYFPHICKVYTCVYGVGLAKIIHFFVIIDGSHTEVESCF